MTRVTAESYIMVKSTKQLSVRLSAFDTNKCLERISGQPGLSVNNSEIEPGKKNQMKRTYIIGDAVQPDADFPNKLTVKAEVIIWTFIVGFIRFPLAMTMRQSYNF